MQINFSYKWIPVNQNYTEKEEAIAEFTIKVQGEFNCYNIIGVIQDSKIFCFK